MMARGKNRDQLLGVGLRLLRERGFSATGIQEIADAAGIPKGSFYNYFPSKEAFALAVLECYGEDAASQICRALESAEGTPLQRVRALFEGQRVRLEQSGFLEGCLAGRLAQELAGENPTFREPLEKTFGRMSTCLTSALREAQASGELDSALEVEELASFLVTSWQGALLRAKSTGSDLPLRLFSDFALGHLLTPRVTTA